MDLEKIQEHTILPRQNIPFYPLKNHVEEVVFQFKVTLRKQNFRLKVLIQDENIHRFMIMNDDGTFSEIDRVRSHIHFLD